MQIECEREQTLKQQEADNMPKQRQLEMQRNLNIQNADVQREALRSTHLTKVSETAIARDRLCVPDAVRSGRCWCSKVYPKFRCRAAVVACICVLSGSVFAGTGRC